MVPCVLAFIFILIDTAKLLYNSTDVTVCLSFYLLCFNLSSLFPNYLPLLIFSYNFQISELTFFFNKFNSQWHQLVNFRHFFQSWIFKSLEDHWHRSFSTAGDRHRQWLRDLKIHLRAYQDTLIPNHYFLNFCTFLASFSHLRPNIYSTVLIFFLELNSFLPLLTISNNSFANLYEVDIVYTAIVIE